MKPSHRLSALTILALLAACAPTTPPPSPPPPAAPAPLAASDADFVQQAAQLNLTEIALAKLAPPKAAKSTVKNYAQRLIAAHSGAQDKLATIASTHGVTLPTAPDADNQQTITSLGGMKRARFDQAYLAATIQAHENAVTFAATEAATTSDAGLKAYAQELEQMAQQHLTAARALTRHPGHPAGYAGARQSRHH